MQQVGQHVTVPTNKFPVTSTFVNIEKNSDSREKATFIIKIYKDINIKVASHIGIRS